MVRVCMLACVCECASVQMCKCEMSDHVTMTSQEGVCCQGSYFYCGLSVLSKNLVLFLVGV